MHAWPDCRLGIEQLRQSCEIGIGVIGNNACNLRKAFGCRRKDDRARAGLRELCLVARVREEGDFAGAGVLKGSHLRDGDAGITANTPPEPFDDPGKR